MDTNTLTAGIILSRAGESPTLRAVSAPALGGTAYVRSMTAGERDAWELAQRDRREAGHGANVRGSLLAATLSDEHGKTLFTAEHADKLAQLPAVAVEPLVAAAFELNGFTDGDMEDLAGKSEPTPDAA